MTKQLNKKGTSLVELIAVIVIMGIIAGIAVPVTIAVINRQKKNAAAKSAEAVVSEIKQLTQELVAKATTSVTITLAYPGTAANKPDTATVKIDSGSDDIGSYPASEWLVENLKATGTIKAVYTLADASYAWTLTNFKVDGYTISVAADGSCTASSAS